MRALLIDTENFRGYIRSIFRAARLRLPSWDSYDFAALLSSQVNDPASIGIFYASRLIEYQDDLEKSRRLIDLQRAFRQHLVSQGFGFVYGKADEIMLARSDSDLLPAVREVQARGVRCTYLGFEFKPNLGLMHAASDTLLLRDEDVLSPPVNALIGI